MNWRWGNFDSKIMFRSLISRKQWTINVIFLNWRLVLPLIDLVPFTNNMNQHFTYFNKPRHPKDEDRSAWLASRTYIETSFQYYGLDVQLQCFNTSVQIEYDVNKDVSAAMFASSMKDRPSYKIIKFQLICIHWCYIQYCTNQLSMYSSYILSCAEHNNIISFQKYYNYKKFLSHNRSKVATSLVSTMLNPKNLKISSSSAHITILPEKRKTTMLFETTAWVSRRFWRPLEPSWRVWSGKALWSTLQPSSLLLISIRKNR